MSRDPSRASGSPRPFDRLRVVPSEVEGRATSRGEDTYWTDAEPDHAAPAAQGALSPSGAPLQPWADAKVVGKPLQRIDAYERVSGAATYAADVMLPDMLHAATLRCPHAHAMVKKIDTSSAEKMPG